MDIIFFTLAILTLGVIPLLLGVVFGKKGREVQQIINPLARGPRYRDGAITYNSYPGGRSNIQLEDPRGPSGSRHRRRHSSKQHKQSKPWER